MARGGFISQTACLTRRLRSVCSNGVSAAALFIPEFAGSLPADRAALTPLARSLAGPPVWDRDSSSAPGGRAGSFSPTLRITTVANPATLSTGTRIVWNPPATPTPPTQLFSSAGPQVVPSPQAVGPAPIPAGFAVAQPQYPGLVGSGPFPGLVHTVAGSAPDFAGSQALIHDQTGKPFLVTMGLNATTWASQGSNPQQQRWQYVDLSA